MRQLGANIRMKESDGVLEIEEDRGKGPHGKVGQRTIWTRAQAAGLLFERRLETARSDLRAQLKYDPSIADNLCKCDPYGKYEFKRAQQTKLIPTSECCGLEVLETANTNALRANRDDVFAGRLVAQLQCNGDKASREVHRIP